MTVADYLIDTSALARVLLGQNATEWDDRIGAGLVAICDITELEVLCSARSTGDRARLKASLDAHYVWCLPHARRHLPPLPRGPGAAHSQGRAPGAGPVDLLVAAAAEESGLTLLHCDRDFETIARTTGQPVREIDLRR